MNPKDTTKIKITDTITSSVKTLTAPQQKELFMLVWNAPITYDKVEIVRVFIARTICEEIRQKGQVIPDDLLRVSKIKLPGEEDAKNSD